REGFQGGGGGCILVVRQKGVRWWAWDADWITGGNRWIEGRHPGELRRQRWLLVVVAKLAAGTRGRRRSWIWDQSATRRRRQHQWLAAGGRRCGGGGDTSDRHRRLRRNSAGGGLCHRRVFGRWRAGAA